MGEGAPGEMQDSSDAVYDADWSKVSSIEQVFAPKVLIGQTVISDYWCLQKKKEEVVVGDYTTDVTHDALFRAADGAYPHTGITEVVHAAPEHKTDHEVVLDTNSSHSSFQVKPFFEGGRGGGG